MPKAVLSDVTKLEIGEAFKSAARSITACAHRRFMSDVNQLDQNVLNRINVSAGLQAVDDSLPSYSELATNIFLNKRAGCAQIVENIRCEMAATFIKAATQKFKKLRYISDERSAEMAKQHFEDNYRDVFAVFGLAFKHILFVDRNLYKWLPRQQKTGRAKLPKAKVDN